MDTSTTEPEMSAEEGNVITSPLSWKGRRAIMLIASAGTLVSCVPPSQTDPLHSSGGASDVLAIEELTADTHLDLLEAVRRLRPRWLRQRGVEVQLGHPIVVYRGDVRVGMIDHLRDIPIEQVAGLRYYDRHSANVRWGLYDVAGVIQVLIH